MNNGGKVESTTVIQGELNIRSGGTASNTTINGGTLHVYKDGSATNTIIHRGSAFAKDGGTATTTHISGGGQIVQSGGTATSTTIHNGAYQNVYGTATSTTITMGGYQNVSNGGKASGTLQGYGSVSTGSDVTVGGTNNFSNVEVSSGGKMSFDKDVSIAEGGKLILHTSAAIAKNPAAPLSINGGMLLVEDTFEGDLAINRGIATLGSLDPTFIQEAIAESGKSAGLYVAKPMDISGQTITVGSDAEALGTDGGISLGLDAVLDINIESATSSGPVLETNKLIIHDDAVLSLSGISHADEYVAYAAGTVEGVFSKVRSDHIGFKAVIDPRLVR